MEMILILSTLFGSISLITGRDTPAYNAITYPALGSNECSHGEEVDGVKWICDPDNIFKLHECKNIFYYFLTQLNPYSTDVECSRHSVPLLAPL